MQRYSPFLTSLLFHYVFSVWCFPEEAVYGDGIFDLGGIEPLFDDSDPNFQPLLDSTPALISARAEEFCSSLDITPNMKVRVRETACPADPQDPSTALDIPILDIFQDANYLCPFDMKIGLRVLVCGKPVSVDGLTPDALIDVKDARLCKSKNAEKMFQSPQLLAFVVTK